jgi:hypothetical protein
LAAASLAAVLCVTLPALFAPGDGGLPGPGARGLYSAERVTRSAFAGGVLPHWDPYRFGGVPHLANIETTVWYPPADLLRALPPLAYLRAMAALHILIGGLGALALGRVVGLRWLPALAAAIATMLGGSVTSWLWRGDLLLLYSAAWLTSALALAILSVRRDSGWPHPLLVIVLVVQFLAGHVQVTVYVAATVCLYFLYSAAWPDAEHRVPRSRPLVQAAVLAALAVGLSAFQLAPMMRLGGEAASAELAFDDAARSGIRLLDLGTLLFPFVEVESGSVRAWIADRASYVGWLLACAIPFAFLDVKRRRLVVFFSLVGCASIALALSSELPFYRVHHALFPGFGTPGRLLLLATPALAVLGGIGLSRFLDVAPRADLWGRSVPMAAAATAATAIATLGIAYVPRGGQWPSYGWWFPFLMLGALALVVLLAARAKPRAAAVAAALVVAGDCALFSRGAVQMIPPPDQSLVQRVIGGSDDGRAVSLCESVLGPQDLLGSQRAAFQAAGAPSLRGSAEWANLAWVDGPLPVRRDLLDVGNVTTVVACEELDAPSLTLVGTATPVHVYRNETAWPRAVWTCGAQKLSSAEAFDVLRHGRYDGDRYLGVGSVIHVRWKNGVDDAQRLTLESRYRLQEPEHREGTTWTYRVHGLSRQEVRDLVENPAVDDTHGVDRVSGEVLDATDAGAVMMVVGTARCDAEAKVDVLALDRPDGLVAVRVDAPADGVLFLSEPYFPEREAFLDGQPAAAERANVAFTAVRVPAGVHDVELRYVPGSLRSGAALSLATLAIWIGGRLLGRRRPAAPVEAAASRARS